MPRPSETSAAVVQLAIYDSREGGSDGDPADQLLAFYPAGSPPEQQAGAVGLIRAVATFAQIFSEVQTHAYQEAVLSLPTSENQRRSSSVCYGSTQA